MEKSREVITFETVRVRTLAYEPAVTATAQASIHHTQSICCDYFTDRVCCTLRLKKNCLVTLRICAMGLLCRKVNKCTKKGGGQGLKAATLLIMLQSNSPSGLIVYFYCIIRKCHQNEDSEWNYVIFGNLQVFEVLCFSRQNLCILYAQNAYVLWLQCTVELRIVGRFQ